MSRTTRIWVLVVPFAVALGAAATALTATSGHVDVPRLSASLVALTGTSFITAGLIARTRRPSNRTGLLLIAVGFAWFISALLTASDNSVLWTLGVSLTAVPAGFLVHLLLAYPSGRLQTRWDLGLVVAGYFLVTVAHAVHLPVDPDPLGCSPDCPDNAVLVSDSENFRLFAVSFIQLVAVVYLLLVVMRLVGRWKHASPAARRVLAPVLLAGAATMLLFAVSVGSQPFSETVAVAAGWIASIVLIEVPFLFLWGLLQSRLARADISRALAEEPAGGVQERIRELLRDPTAELFYEYGQPHPRYLDVDGRPRVLIAEAGRTITLVERQGRSLGAIAHDDALLEEPELLQQVAAAVALEVERDQNLRALQASERRSRALLDALPDKMFRLRADGVILDLQENDQMSPARMTVGSNVYDGDGRPEITNRVMAVGRQALATGELQTMEWDGEIGGELLHLEGRFIPSGEDEFYVVVRDVTKRKRQELEKAALHRVALAVASEAPSAQVFDLVAEEVGRLLGSHSAHLIRYENNASEAVIVGAWRKEGIPGWPVGRRYPMQGTASEVVLQTGEPVRRDRGESNVPPELAAVMQELGINSLVAVPVTGAGQIWGSVVASLTGTESFPPRVEQRIAAFTQLVSLAVANEEAREQLASSRARLVSASDKERRRLERNLHDGAQQRLVSVSVALRLAEAKLQKARAEEAADLMAEANAELGLALEELRELARGIHPAVLTERGLGPALASLADRAPLPVSLEGLPGDRLPGRVEAAAYYVVSEALANVAKYAHASAVTVRIGRQDGRAVIEVLDDGVGGANPRLGSGLNGLTDRVEALDGELRIVSPPGQGTAIRAEIPCQ
jgi:signal transduction histidine kinase